MPWRKRLPASLTGATWSHRRSRGTLQSDHADNGKEEAAHSERERKHEEPKVVADVEKDDVWILRVVANRMMCSGSIRIHNALHDRISASPVTGSGARGVFFSADRVAKLDFRLVPRGPKAGTCRTFMSHVDLSLDDLRIDGGPRLDDCVLYVAHPQSNYHRGQSHACKERAYQP